MEIKRNRTKAMYALLAAMPFASVAAPNPVTWDKMVAYVNGATVLTAADWAAACTSGSPTSATGCYGTSNSTAFTKINNRTGGFTSYANINPTNAPANSVFIKAFLAGTNTPVGSTALDVSVINSAARCVLFYQQGLGVGTGGIATYNPAPGNTPSEFQIGPQVATVVTFNSASSASALVYNAPFDSPASPAVIPNPLYLVCAGYSPADGSTAAALTVTAV